ncbi:MAG: hypothetical protein KME12_05000 [Trichocoleus desertorum ATA4-8-CV12]|nr:hypothetical protein [Trichocoleus desertorum ATA4-8-CV12]
MMPNLLAATQDYWRKLNELEAAYQRGEVSLPEVDARVAELMSELGQERRAAIDFTVASIGHLWNQQRETVVGVSLLGMLTYAWAVMS